MSDVIDFYLNSATSSDKSLLSVLKQQGCRALENLGFPTRKQEDWRYSEPKAWLNQEFQTSHPIPMKDFSSLPEGIRVIFDGVNIQCSEPLPKGVHIQSLQEALQKSPEILERYLGQQALPEHGFIALNTAMLNLGVCIQIDEGVILNTPIILCHWSEGLNSALYWRHLVTLGEGAHATIIEDYQGDASNYFTSAITEIFLQKQARLEHIKFQSEGLKAFHVGNLYATLEKQSQLFCHLLNLGGAWVRCDTQIAFKAEGAKACLNGLYLPAGSQHHDQHTVIEHGVPHCMSEQDYKGVVSGKARAVFDGQVVVARDAIKTEAHQQNKNLLLSLEAEIDTKPQLEIDADDVICSHGATVGQLSEEALFYLASRGISHEEGKMLLIAAFAAENLQQIQYPEILRIAKARVTNKLETDHGCCATG